MTHKIQLNDLHVETELSAQDMAATRGGWFTTAMALNAQRMTMLRYSPIPYSTARYTISPYATARYTVSPYSTARYTLGR